MRKPIKEIDEAFSRKSKKYRMAYLQAFKTLSAVHVKYNLKCDSESPLEPSCESTADVIHGG